MTDNSLSHNADGPSPPEIPPGLSPQQYRTAAHEAACFVLASGALTVTLLEDPHRARFTLDCVVAAARGPAPETQAFAVAEWVFDIPAPESDVSGVRAWDGAGNLETTLDPAEGRAARLRVRFRRLVRDGGQYRFSFTYEAPVRTVVCAGSLTRVVVCSGWLIFNLPCASVRVCIQLPERARLVKSAPLGEVTEPEQGPPRVRYHVERLRALESSQWLVAYEQRKVGLPLYLWTATQVVAGFAGWLIARALDGWTGAR